jgi:sugar phosphate isomerase/epimerase
VWDLCKQYGVTFDLECHPSERAMGDLESAGDYINFMNRAGYDGVVGFNLDGSHLEWQNVSVIDFIREYADYIHCAHVKGVWVAREHCRAGRLGGHRPMGHWANGWNFVTAGTARDANPLEEIFIELNRVGYDGAVSIEWEDNDAEQHAGAKQALANARKADLPPSGMRHDEMLKA